MATQPMLQFVTNPRQMPEERDATERRGDFDEIYREFAAVRAAEQAARCSQCGVPYCQTHCPLHNNIPDWLMLTAKGRLEEAYETAQATNIFSEICGRICPQDRLCEGSCVIEQAGHGTVTIGAIEKYITDTAWQKGWVKPIRPPVERPESVGVIGAGPGGLAAADRLRRAGIQVTVYDRYDRAGGLMTYGIPGFKLEKPVIMRRIEQLEAGGVQFVLNCNVGEDISFAAIRGQHDAVLIATGVYKSRELEGSGAVPGGIERALDYLTASNRQCFGDEVPEFDSGALNAAGKRVVVIGGGDTAMEEAQYLTRMCKKVHLIHRRDEFRASQIMQKRTLENPKIEVHWNRTVDEVLGKDRVEGLRLRSTVDDSVEPLTVTGLFLAIGHVPNSKIFKGQLDMDEVGYLKVEPGTTRTNIEGVFASGDVADKLYRQAVTAAGTGCMASIDAERWLAEQE